MKLCLILLIVLSIASCQTEAAKRKSDLKDANEQIHALEKQKTNYTALALQFKKSHHRDSANWYKQKADSVDKIINEATERAAFNVMSEKGK